MDKNAIAKELTDLGKSDARLLDRLGRQSAKVAETYEALEANRARRCELLTGCIPDAGLDPDVVTAARAPKNEPPRG